jgi:CubicO group peptidase (beta-lactamase class C family)
MTGRGWRRPPTRWRALAMLLLSCALPVAAAAPGFDYFLSSRQLIRNGVQAVLACNGLFTSGRSLVQVERQELAYLQRFEEHTQAGDMTVYREQRAVSVGSPGQALLTAAYREGIGCVVMAPGAPLTAIDDLPALDRPPPSGNPDTLPWPEGDLVTPAPLPPAVDAAALEAAADWAFERDTPEQVTVSLLVLYRGQIILERYAAGFDRNTRTRTWSTAKSIAATLLGLLVDRGQLALDEPLDLPWRPHLSAEERDPRRAITLRHLLHMSSGLYPVDSFDREYATGSGLAYWAGASSAAGALDRGLVRQPGSYWDYENYDTLLAVYAMKQALGQARYHRFPRDALLDRLGMRSTLLGTDRFGDFILSSQVYTNARDLARFGLLYLQDGRWHGEQLLSREWIEFIRSPAPATAGDGKFYGGHWWLVPEARRQELPPDAYSTAGNRGQFVIVVPSHDLLIVRRGLDFGAQGFDRWDLAREVIKAVRQVD